jgi:hypothetical protein
MKWHNIIRTTVYFLRQTHLTDSQIDSLDKPIIWEVYQKVASGEVVRVPRLYIPIWF